MDSAISAAFNPIALYGTYMRLLYCGNYFILYASFCPPPLHFTLFLTFYSHLTWALTSQAWRPGRKTCCPGWTEVAVEPRRALPIKDDQPLSPRAVPAPRACPLPASRKGAN